LRRAGEAQRALSMADELAAHKLRPSASTYHCVMLASGKAKEARLIKEAFDEVSDSCVCAWRVCGGVSRLGAARG
jgi:hypothetical protein